jgi:hypothetical protein
MSPRAKVAQLARIHASQPHSDLSPVIASFGARKRISIMHRCHQAGKGKGLNGWLESDGLFGIRGRYRAMCEPAERCSEAHTENDRN